MNFYLNSRLGNYSVLQYRLENAQICAPNVHKQRAIVKSIDVENESYPQLDRRILLLTSAILPIVTKPSPSKALGFTKELKKRKLTSEDYTSINSQGLKFIDVKEGNGQSADVGDRVIVHFDVMYRGLDVVSSRSARLLGGNRTIAEPFDYIVGQPLAEVRSQYGEKSGGLYAGSSGPKPPPALSIATVGMKAGGTRSFIVDNADLGYGTKGIQELPPGEPFELRVDLLQVFKKG